MKDYIMFMQDDGDMVDPKDVAAYIQMLQMAGVFQGGSAIGDGVTMSLHGASKPITGHIGGYMKISVESLEQAKTIVEQNPFYLAGATIELRELPKT